MKSKVKVSHTHRTKTSAHFICGKFIQNFVAFQNNRFAYSRSYVFNVCLVIKVVQHEDNLNSAEVISLYFVYFFGIFQYLWQISGLLLVVNLESKRKTYIYG